ncbi:hypothetical protein VUR80DRAFT_4547 [Thermomyces stellatus]
MGCCDAPVCNFPTACKALDSAHWIHRRAPRTNWSCICAALFISRRSTQPPKNYIPRKAPKAHEVNRCLRPERAFQAVPSGMGDGASKPSSAGRLAETGGYKNRADQPVIHSPVCASSATPAPQKYLPAHPPIPYRFRDKAPNIMGRSRTEIAA